MPNPFSNPLNSRTKFWVKVTGVIAVIPQVLALIPFFEPYQSIINTVAGFLATGSISAMWARLRDAFNK